MRTGHNRSLGTTAGTVCVGVGVCVCAWVCVGGWDRLLVSYYSGGP